jgi:hypothetical protein
MSSNPNLQPPAPAASPQSPWKKIRTWLVAILCVVVVLYIGATRVYSFFDSLHDYASDTVNHFYTAIKGQDYATAFSYLAPGMETLGGAVLTQADFTQQAKSIDQAKGVVKSYKITNIAPGAQDGTKDITVSVTRNGAPYDVDLNVTEVSTDNWGISKYDDL